MKLYLKSLFRWLCQPEKSSHLYWLDYSRRREEILASGKTVPLPGDQSGKLVRRLVALHGHSPYWAKRFRVGCIEGDRCELYLPLFNEIINILSGKTDKLFFAVDPDGKLLNIRSCSDSEKEKEGKIHLIM